MLALSKADACVVIGRQQSAANVRWASNSVTTNGVADQAVLSVVSIVGRRVASVTRTHFPPDRLEAMVRESEDACRNRPDAPDFVPLVDGDAEPGNWRGPADATDVRVFGDLVPQLGTLFSRARETDVATFGYAEHTATTTWLATSTGLRRRDSERLGKIDVTAKSPDFARSSWAGMATSDFGRVDTRALFDELRDRLAWSTDRVELPPSQYEVLLTPSATADLALCAYAFMARRDADEGRSPFAKSGGATRIGDRLFGDLTMYSDPLDAEIPTAPFHVGTASDSASSVFDNGLALERTDWVRDGVLGALVTPRYWAERVGAPTPTPFINNLVVAGSGPSLDEMIAATTRGLLVTCLWYIRPVDPQTALMTGLTRDGVFLIEHGKVMGAVNNFRWNMSPIAAFSQATEIGLSRMALPREHDEFLRMKAPPVRIDRFKMSSVSEAT